MGFSNVNRNNTEEDQGRYLVSAITSNMWGFNLVTSRGETLKYSVL